MAVEIERKFLVTGAQWQTQSSTYCCQGYLNRDRGRTVRVRIMGGEAFLTVKGITQGATRDEYEYSIPPDDAKALLDLCELPLIEKHRHRVRFEGMEWEIDEFLGVNQGLVIAEIELQSEDQEFSFPDWIGAEVTHDQRYFNSNLVSHPYSCWDDR